MNIAQLERMLKLVQKLNEILKEDQGGGFSVARDLDLFEETLKTELKEKVWLRYLEEAKE